MGCCSSNPAQVFLAPKPVPGTAGSTFVRQMSNIREHYTVVKTLGTGKFGCAYLVKDKRSGVERVAKEVIKSLVNTGFMAKLEVELNNIRQLVRSK